MAFIGITAETAAAEPESAISPALEGGGRDAAPAGSERGRRAGRLAGLMERVRASVWLPVGLRAAGIGAGMLALASIGAVSIVSGLDGVAAPSAMPLAADVHSAWLSLESVRRPPAGTPAHAPQTSTRAAADGAGAEARSAPPAARSPGITEDGKVILNLADATQLTRLPGVGKRRAEAIIELRARLKRFRRPQDLLRVRGIGVRTLKRMLPHLVLDPPKPQAPAEPGR